MLEIKRFDEQGNCLNPDPSETEQQRILRLLNHWKHCDTPNNLLQAKAQQRITELQHEWQQLQQEVAQ